MSENRISKSILLLSVAGGLLCAGGAAAAQDAPIVQPGAPGQDARDLTAEEATRIADTRYSPADRRYMQDMIHHHYQAVEMAALVEARTNNPAIVTAAARIDASQEDEIAFMQDWLRSRSEDAPDPASHAGMNHADMGHGTMTGMASSEEMERLASLQGTEFDRLFLELMIDHHDGALVMTDELLDQPGSAYDPALFEFTSEVVNSQEAEIERMNLLLSELSADPRAVLGAGFRDAEEAISNMTLVAALPKPTGFFDPANPAALQPVVPADGKDEGEENESEQEETQENAQDGPRDGDGEDDTVFGERSPLLSFANTDMAFFGDTLIAGNYHGFNIYKLSEDGVPQHLSSVVCPGGQGDVSVVGDLLIMSVEQTRGRVDCGLQGVAEDVSEERFRGLRIFDIADLRRPRQVGQVQTCRGSHTHSVVSSNEDRIVVYNSGTAGVRDDEELEGCIGGVPGDARTALFRIDVIEIPVENPSAARIVDSPAVFADAETGNLAGLWQGGDHGEGTQDTKQTNQCHDITVFPSRNLAAGACSGNGIIFDITDPRKPARIDAVTDDGFAYWHSATFNNDGTKVLFTDEWGGGSRPRCRAFDRTNWGANAFYDIVDGQLEARGHYKLPAPQSDKENCVAHNGSIIPVPGRDIFVQAWYQGGISVIDFTDSANPVEIAYFDRGPIDAEQLVLGGYWSAYWYDGRIYGTEIARGLDVLALTPGDYLTEDEIAAAALAEQGGAFNPQQQFPVSWPDHPVVARAYVDQLARAGALEDEAVQDMDAALTQAEARIDASEQDADLAERLEAFTGAGRADGKAAALDETLTGIAARLRGEG